jgi:CelD/BcsL family acetyltransferase involved in cellulose biosynthesis
MVLCARSGETAGDYDAFLPLRLRTSFGKDGFYHELTFAGEAYSDYGGVLARPEIEAEALPAFGQYIRRNLHWARLTMDNLAMSMRRRRLLLSAFEGRGLIVEQKRSIDEDCGIDNDLCPAAALPGDWDAYLGGLSANNRQKIRRLLRRLEESAEVRITEAGPDDIERCLTGMLDLWRVKWAWQKAERTELIIARNHDMLLRCAARGRLFLPVFWRGERLVAALACVIDPVKGAMNFLITGRDETYEDLPAGYLLHAYSIRRAIGLGLTTYDFLRGDEPYKYLFSNRERRIGTVTVRAPKRRNLSGKLDPREVHVMIAHALDLEQKEPGQARLAYQQLVELAPEHDLILYRAARLLFARGAYAEAAVLAARSVQVEPAGDNAWLLLARARRFVADDAGALEAYRAVLRLRPAHEEALKGVVELSLAGKPAARHAPMVAAGLLAPARPA